MDAEQYLAHKHLMTLHDRAIAMLLIGAAIGFVLGVVIGWATPDAAPTPTT